MLNYYSAMRYAHGFCENEGFSLEVSENVDTACTDGKRIIMPPYPVLQGEEAESEWLATLAHEVYHHDWPEDFEVLHNLKLQRCLYTEVLNTITDHNIERCRHGEYVGRDKNIRNHRDNVVRQWNEPGKFVPESKSSKIDAAIMVWDRLLRQTWQGTTVAPPSIGEEGDAMVGKLLADEQLCRDYVQPRAGGMPNKEMADRIFSVLEVPEEEQTNGQGGVDEESCKKRGEEQSEGDEGQEEKGKGKGKGTMGDSKDGKTRMDEAHVKFRELSGEHEHTGQPSANMFIDYTDHKQGDHYTPPTDKIVLQREPGDYSSYIDHRKGEAIKLLSMSGDLPRRIRNELKIASVVRNDRGRKSGRIDRKKISKVATRSKSENLFVRRGIPKDILDAAAFLLVDCSGSMGGDKYNHATAGAVLLHRALDALKIPVSIGGFTNRGKRPKFYEFQRFGERVIEDELLNRMGAVDMCANPDGEALLWATSHLLPRKEKRKLLIVLSDGSPAFSREFGDSSHFLKRVAGEIETKSSIDLIGIGIMDDNVERYYNNHLVINHASELESSILNVVKHSLLK